MAERALIVKTSEAKWKAPSSRFQTAEHTRSIKSSALKAKLRIGQPNDIYEQEADRVAEQVMRMPDPVLQRRCAKCDEDQKKVLQTKKLSGQASLIQGQDVPPIVHDVLRSPGQPLDTATRAFMEPRFGHDFSGVRVHTDAKAAESAKTVNALAYTLESDLVFGKGQFSPDTNSGKMLLAHELAHVVQQIDKGSSKKLSTNNMKSPLIQCKTVCDELGGNCQSLPEETRIDKPTTEMTKKTQANVKPLDNDKVAELPVTFEASEIELPSTPFIDLGLSSNMLASGDMSWLPPKDAASRVLSRDYWSPFMHKDDTVTLERLVNEIPRDLAPKIEGELAARSTSSSQPLSWTSHGYTEADLKSIPELVHRLNTKGIVSLTPKELKLLRDAAARHIDSSSAGSPFASYMRPNAPPPNVGLRQFRVQVRVPSTSTLDVSEPNRFNEGAYKLTNVEESEFMLTTSKDLQIVNVQRIAEGASGETGFLMRNASKIRWGGRIILVAGIGTAMYNVADAPEGERATVAAEEAGGMAMGAAGSALAAAGCLALGVPTGGIAIFLCGLVGGVEGGILGSAVVGKIVRSNQSTPEEGYNECMRIELERPGGTPSEEERKNSVEVLPISLLML